MIVQLILLLSLTAAAQAAREVCYNRLGCFTDSPPYSSTPIRPIRRLPWAPDVVNVQFLLFTRENPDQYQIISALNVTTVSGTNFKSSRKSIFIVHGFLSKGDDKWLVEMCKNFLNLSDVNCFCVDWNGGSVALYTQASNNVRVVGAEIAYFLHFLETSFDYDMSDVHLIGHSLGSHVVGEAGKRQMGIGRISGLDPAGPYFEHTPPEVRLDRTDAVFVDAIHTDGSSIISHLGFGGYGMMETCGNVDFYPNGGKRMPGCEKISPRKGDLDEILDGLVETALCNHVMSVQYFSKSILSPDGFLGYSASSYEAFQKGSGFPCTNVSCASMGYEADEYEFGHDQESTINEKFFLNTGDPTNFQRWRYQVTVHVTLETPVLVGTFGVTVCGKKACSRYLEIHSGAILPFISYAAFVETDVDVNPVQRVVFMWKKEAPPFIDPLLGASSVAVLYGESGKTYRFCSKEQVEEGANQVLNRCPSLVQ
ncbi:pancreatic lipase-related protein 2-like [Mantella aurantiaca]